MASAQGAQFVEGFDDLIGDIALSLSPTELFRRATGFAPFRWQVRALNSIASRQIWNIARQCAKSTTAAVPALQEALFNPGALVLMVSPSLRQSSELFRKYLDSFHRVMPEGYADLVTAESTLRMELVNGARVISLPGVGDSVRGFSKVNLLLIDEASRVDASLIAAMKPSLATSKRQKIVALSTPNGLGPDNWFSNTWHYTEGWEKYEVRASQIPTISKEFLAAELRDQGPAVYQQEYECCFLPDGAQIFDDRMVAQCLDTNFWPSISFNPRG